MKAGEIWRMRSVVGRSGGGLKWIARRAGWSGMERIGRGRHKAIMLLRRHVTRIPSITIRAVRIESGLNTKCTALPCHKILDAMELI